MSASCTSRSRCAHAACAAACSAAAPPPPAGLLLLSLPLELPWSAGRSDGGRGVVKSAPGQGAACSPSKTPPAPVEHYRQRVSRVFHELSCAAVPSTVPRLQVGPKSALLMSICTYARSKPP